MPNKLLQRLVVLACLSSMAHAAPLPFREKEKEVGLRSGQTVILGTWAWKIEGNKLGDTHEADFWWEQVNATERHLVPQGGAGWAVLKGKPFETITLEDLAKADYLADKLSGTLLVPDAVVALRTRDGKFAKAKVVGYRELHDFSFPEAKHLTPAWRQFVLQKPNTKEYHLEVKWVFYGKK